MQAYSGVALVAAAFFLLIAERRACRLDTHTWITSDVCVLAVVGPMFIVALVSGAGLMIYPGGRDEDFLAAILGAAFAVAVASFASMAWWTRRNARRVALAGAEILEFAPRTGAPSTDPAGPDAPRPPVIPSARRAA
jgi:hypothetical protein